MAGQQTSALPSTAQHGTPHGTFLYGGRRFHDDSPRQDMS